MTAGIGHGLPWWLPEDFLNVEQTTALGEVSLNLDPQGRCPACVAGIPKRDVALSGLLDQAHIVDKQMGGRPNGSGPTVGICRGHHDTLHFSGDGIFRTMAIRDRDGAVCWLESDALVKTAGNRFNGPSIKVTVMGFAHPWGWL